MKNLIVEKLENIVGNDWITKAWISL